MDEKKTEETKLPIEWYIAEDLKSQYATNIVIQHTDQEFLISFFEIKHPIILGADEEVKSTYEKIGKLKADCIARIIVTPDRMKNFINAMRENYDRFQGRLQAKETKS